MKELLYNEENKIIMHKLNLKEHKEFHSLMPLSLHWQRKIMVRLRLLTMWNHVSFFERFFANSSSSSLVFTTPSNLAISV